ncbi:thiolase family protein [soil metagenome]
MNTPYLRGVATSAFGLRDGVGVLDLLGEAAIGALDDAGVQSRDVDGVLCGYATTMPHLMLSTVFCERMGLTPSYAHGMSLGGATGAAMAMLAGDLVRSGRCRNVLVVGGENRATGQSRNDAIQTLAQVGDADFEVPNGGSIPAYYAMLASAYMARTGLEQADLAELAVMMRRHASTHPQAHLREIVSVEQVMASKPIAEPLKLLDCCPISDGRVALLVSSTPGPGRAVEMAGAGQAHLHQHLSATEDVFDTGARRASDLAFAQAGVDRAEVDYLGVYDSFTITLAMLLEETGFAPRGRSPALARDGVFSADGKLPLNTHGGLLSFGHSGVAGGMAHVVEAVRQLSGRAGERQLPSARSTAFIHADGGVLSSHVSLVLRAQRGTS